VSVALRRDGNHTAPEVEQLRELAAALSERNRQLEEALSSRIVIEQAKGMIAERLELTPDEAFELIRGAARRNRIRIRDLATEIVTTRRVPVPLTD